MDWLGGSLSDIEIGFIRNLDPSSRTLKRLSDCIMKPLALLSRKEAMIRMGCHETQIIRGIVAVRPWISTSDNGPEATRG
jgi:hypothetical protein